MQNPTTLAQAYPRLAPPISPWGRGFRGGISNPGDRFYAPTEPYFDRTCLLPDIEKVI